MNAAASTFYFGRAREITEFCIPRNGRDCFTNWDVPTLFAYVFFHLVDRTVFSTRKNGALSGAMFVWGASEAEIQSRAASGQSPFKWRRSEDQSDSLFLAEVIAQDGELPRLFKQATGRFQDWQQKKVFTYRRKALVQIPSETIDRLIYGRA